MKLTIDYSFKGEGYLVGFTNTRIYVWTYCHKSIYIHIVID